MLTKGSFTAAQWAKQLELWGIGVSASKPRHQSVGPQKCSLALEAAKIPKAAALGAVKRQPQTFYSHSQSRCVMYTQIQAAYVAAPFSEVSDSCSVNMTARVTSVDIFSQQQVAKHNTRLRRQS